ncbi:transketolase [Candidatus Pacearchaeota archaeon]|nr:transketolase [Candidatus Pacearchaeota archaeon]
MNEKELSDIANLMRRDVLQMTTAAGSGHPTSCLSCAEIMSVLFFDEMKYDVKNYDNPDNDEFILSKGHAAPILYSALYHTGCIKTDLMSLRKLSSPLEGHPVPRSFGWVKVATGSLGQGSSVGVGMALAAKMQKRKFKVYVLMGDSESSEGSVYEAMQIASFYKLDNLFFILDVNRLGQSGETMLGHQLEVYRRRFAAFGFDVEVCDGQDVGEIKNSFRNFKENGKPKIILAKTFKGKGVSFLENKEGWHGKALREDELKKALREIQNVEMPFVKIKKPKKFFVKFAHGQNKFKDYEIGEKIATRESYGETLAELAKLNDKIIVVDGEVSNSTRSEEVKKIKPSQFVEGFVAEQNMVGMSLGLSVKGFDVFGSTFAAFLSRAHDQIRMAALSSGKFTLCGSHCGVSIGQDGASQMGLEDLAMFRALPNSYVFYPSDAVSTQTIVKDVSKLDGIKYIRTTRSKTKTIYEKKEKFPVGDFKVLRESGKDEVVLVGAGITLHEALEAQEILKKKKIECAVIDLYCIKPFNEKKFITFVKKHGKKIVVVEDHYAEGGIGEMLKGILSGSGFEVEHLAVREIPHSGTGVELLEKYGIDRKAIVKAVKKLL